MVTVHDILLVAACISFFCTAVSVQTFHPRLSWIGLGLFLWSASWFV